MADFRSQETVKIAANSADQSQNLVTGCKRIVMVADADAFVDFDRPAILNSSFYLPAKVVVSIPYLEYTQVHAIAASSANVYFLCIR